MLLVGSDGVTTSGSDVTDWLDQSSAGINFSEADRNATEVTVNGVGALHLGSEVVALQADTAASLDLRSTDDYSIYVLVRPSNSSGWIFTRNSGGSKQQWGVGLNASKPIATFGGTTATHQSNATTNGSKVHCISMHANSGTGRVRFDGVYGTTSVSVGSQTTTSAATIGARVNGGGYSFDYDGDILAILVVEGALSEEEVQRYEAWLMWLGGVQDSLPTSAIYYASPPILEGPPETGLTTYGSSSGHTKAASSSYGVVPTARTLVAHQTDSNGGRSSSGILNGYVEGLRDKEGVNWTSGVFGSLINDGNNIAWNSAAGNPNSIGSSDYALVIGGTFPSGWSDFILQNNADRDMVAHLIGVGWDSTRDGFSREYNGSSLIREGDNVFADFSGKTLRGRAWYIASEDSEGVSPGLYTFNSTGGTTNLLQGVTNDDAGIKLGAGSSVAVVSKSVELADTSEASVRFYPFRRDAAQDAPWYALFQAIDVVGEKGVGHTMFLHDGGLGSVEACDTVFNQVTEDWLDAYLLALDELAEGGFVDMRSAFGFNDRNDTEAAEASAGDHLSFDPDSLGNQTTDVYSYTHEGFYNNELSRARYIKQRWDALSTSSALLFSWTRSHRIGVEPDDYRLLWYQKAIERIVDSGEFEAVLLNPAAQFTYAQMTGGYSESLYDGFNGDVHLEDSGSGGFDAYPIVYGDVAEAYVKQYASAGGFRTRARNRRVR